MSQAALSERRTGLRGGIPRRRPGGFVALIARARRRLYWKKSAQFVPVSTCP
jgi:hypothetical protein